MTMTIELLTLPNVRMGKGCEHFEEAALHIDAKALAWVVATKNPLWTVEVTGYRDYRVLCDNEEIGKVGAEWHGSSHKLFVRNDRIGQSNMRKNSYHTDKVDKAYLKVKKTFGTMTLNERVAKSMKVAESALENQGYRTQTKMREHERPIENGLYRWARDNMSHYVSWLKEKHQTSMLEHLTLLEDVKADMVTIQETTKAFQNQKTALVVLEGGGYIVKIRDNVQLYDDMTLPVELRGKLGMLKLVDNEAMVTGIGCRVSNEIFVLLLEEENNDA